MVKAKKEVQEVSAVEANTKHKIASE